MFFVFEGGDGCGKSTQTRLLAELVERRCGAPALLVREPGGTRLGEELRRVLLEPGPEELAPETELYLFLAARSHLVRQRIAPALAAGRVVISDRFLWSSAAYQGAGSDLEPGAIVALGQPAVSGAPVTLTIVLDLDPAVALARCGEADRMESRGVRFQQRVRQNFLELAAGASDAACVVDASGSPEAVHARVLEHVLPLLEARGEGAP